MITEIKTHTGMVSNELVIEENKLVSGGLDGSFMVHTHMDYDNLNVDVQGKDIVYDAVLKELLKHKKELEEGKTVIIHVEWDVLADYTKYISCNVLKVETKD